MSPADLIALAERVEKAEGPDRELDALIWCALNGKKYLGHHRAYASYGQDNPETQVEFTEPPKRKRMVSTGSPLPHAQPWTASLDAAMTLVPKGFRWWFSCGSVRPTGEPPEANESFAQVWKSERNTVYHRAGDEQHGKIATPALALTAAALRARAAQS